MNIDRWLVLSLFAGYTSKVLVLGASPADAAVILVLAAAHFLYGKDVQNKKLAELENIVKQIQSTQTTQNEVVSEVKTMVMGIKLSGNLRGVK